MAIRNDTYAAVRAEVGTLLNLSALATICHRHPEARKMLQQTINNHAREVELLQQKRRPANGKS
jgi:hypothetical protein